MINVRVRDKDLLQFQAQLTQPPGDETHLIAGVNHNGLASRLIAKQSAVAAKNAHGKGLEDHGTILGGARQGAGRQTSLHWTYVYRNH